MNKPKLKYIDSAKLHGQIERELDAGQFQLYIDKFLDTCEKYLEIKDPWKIIELWEHYKCISVVEVITLNLEWTAEQEEDWGFAKTFIYNFFARYSVDRIKKALFKREELKKIQKPKARRSNMKLLIDWSVLCHISWHRMNSPDYEARTDVEQAEFARNIAGMIYYYQRRFKPSEIIFALDGKNYWRYAAFDKYYSKNTYVYHERVPGETADSMMDQYYMEYDQKCFLLKYHTGMEKWLKTKLKVTEVTEMKAGIFYNIIKLLMEKEIPYEIMELYPKYKGSRKESKWDYTTTRNEFKEMCNSIARHLAGTFKARIVQVDSAEADDIAGIYYNKHSAEDLIYITTDSDWHQLLRKGLFLKLYDPRKNEWVEKTAEQSSMDLAIKIIGGDSSDGISGLSLPNKNGVLVPVGAKNAEKLVIEQGVPEVYEYLKQNADMQQLGRNYQLIFFGNIPKKTIAEIEESLSSKLQHKGEVYNTKNYGLEKRDILGLQAEADEARNSDIEDGMYE